MAAKLALVFTISKKNASLRTKIWRKLKEINAKNELKSYWSLAYNVQNLKKFQNLAREIQKNNESAEIFYGNPMKI